MAARTDIRRLDRCLLLFCLAVLGLTVLYPALRLLVQALLTWDMAALRHGAGLAAIRNTFLISLASVACAGLLGVPLAFFVSRYAFPGRGLLAALAYLPLTLPPLVGVLSFYYLIGRDGILPRLLIQGFGVQNAVIPGPVAILIIHAYSFQVFFYAMTATALESLDRTQVEAARTLGAGPARVLRRVVFPHLRPALLGASLLTFMSSAASFSAPYFFGQDFPVLSVQIFNERMQFNNGAAFTLTVVLAAVSLAGLALFRGRPAPAGGGSKGVRTALRSRRGRVAAGALAWSLIALLLTPHVLIVWLSFGNYRDWSTELLPLSFTFENYARLFRDASTFAPIRNSLWMALAAAGLTAAVALPAGYLTARRRPGGRWIGMLTMLPWALPGTVIAMNLIAAFNDPWMPLYNTVWMLPVAYFVRNIPLLTRMAGAAIETFDASLLEAGQSLGASRAYCLRRIAAPLLAPALVAGTALVVAENLGEFVASILLYVPGNLPISVQINMAWRNDAGAAFAYSVLLMALVAITFVFARRLAVRSL